MAIVESQLIEAAIDVGLLSAEELTVIRKQANRRQTRIAITSAIMREKRLPLSAFYQANAQKKGFDYIQPGNLNIDSKTLKMLTPALVQRRLMIPVLHNKKTHLAVGDPDDITAIESIFRVLGKQLPLVVTEPISLEWSINQLYSMSTVNSDIDSVGIFDEVMQEAYLYKASDIHIEPEKEVTRIRLRINGTLQNYKRLLNEQEMLQIVNRAKVLAGMDISESRVPQDSGFTYKIIDWEGDYEMDLRVATMPLRWGERVTIRVLGAGSEGLSLEQLGMPTQILNDFKNKLNKLHGIILVTGPTGSGKSTTLYAALRELNTGMKNILTVEDPVEQEIDGISQVACNKTLTFSSALRSFLRHDPDIILVGEIRDLETADIAMKAAMTGHLVLSTLHTNDALMSIMRLKDIGVDDFLIADTVIGTLAQRLIKQLCPNCKQATTPTPNQAEILGVDVQTTIYKPVGCASCVGSGYIGRIGVYEALWINEELSLAITAKKSKTEIQQIANNEHLLWFDARQKLLDGETSFKEILTFNPNKNKN